MHIASRYLNQESDNSFQEKLLSSQNSSIYKETFVENETERKRETDRQPKSLFFHFLILSPAK